MNRVFRQIGLFRRLLTLPSANPDLVKSNFSIRNWQNPVCLAGNVKSSYFRCFSSEEDESRPSGRQKLLPPLMSFPEIIWPSFIKSFRSFFFLHIIIRPYLDNDFNLTEFVSGTKQALTVVSAKLSDGDWEGLKDFVSEDIISELRENQSKMSVAQRKEIAIKKEDIYLSYPYQV